MQYNRKNRVYYNIKTDNYDDDEWGIANNHCFSTKRVFRVRFHPWNTEFLQGEEHLRHT